MPVDDNLRGWYSTEQFGWYSEEEHEYVYCIIENGCQDIFVKQRNVNHGVKLNENGGTNKVSWLYYLGTFILLIYIIKNMPDKADLQWTAAQP